MPLIFLPIEKVNWLYSKVVILVVFQMLSSTNTLKSKYDVEGWLNDNPIVCHSSVVKVKFVWDCRLNLNHIT